MIRATKAIGHRQPEILRAELRDQRYPNALELIAMMAAVPPPDRLLDLPNAKTTSLNSRSSCNGG